MEAIVADLGIEDYNEILDLQRNLSSMRNEDLIPDTLLFLQHNHTYTAGIHRNPQDIVVPGTEVINVERGGALTYHGPGQLVVYFILNLNRRKQNIKDIILMVQGALTSVLDDYGIEAEGRLDKHTGVWVGQRKICSVGFAIKESSTLHGIALNINTDLSRFSSIMPCGFNSEIMTSMKKEIGQELDFSEVSEKLRKLLLEKLDFDKIIEVENISDIPNFS